MLRIMLTVLAALAAATAAKGASPLPSRACGTVAGVHWTAEGKSGSRYRVRASGGASCSVALAAVPKLTHANVKSRAAKLQGSPRGYTCIPLIAAADGVYAVVCARGDNPARGAFNWSPLGLH
jgi:hypothetical protein